MPPTWPSSSRRDFLSGRSAVCAARRLVADALREPSSAPVPGCPSGGAAEASYLIEFRREAMATVFEILVNADGNERSFEAAVAALDLVDQLEAQMTVYREESELSRINHEAAMAAVSVEPGLFALLKQALELSRETGGAYDITTSALSRAWGFSRRRGRIPTESELAKARESIGHIFVDMDEEASTVRFRREGISLNLGSIGKGYALDRAGAILREAGCEDYLLHGGTSSVLARGRRADGSGTPGWRVGVCHPMRTDVRLAEIRLENQGLGTSGSGRQFFHHQGRRLSHILDPRTLWPAEGVLSVTVVAPDATRADALSTAFFVMGCDASLAFCSQREELSVLFVLPGKKEGQVELVAHGFAEDRLQVHGVCAA